MKGKRNCKGVNFYLLPKIDCNENVAAAAADDDHRYPSRFALNVRPSIGWLGIMGKDVILNMGYEMRSDLMFFCNLSCL